jgi:hypothetical protein
MKVKFGLWVMDVGLRIARMGMNLSGVTDTLAETLHKDDGFLIHNVIDGPFTREDMPEYDWAGPNEAEAYLIVKLQHNGSVSDQEWYFETVEEAFTWVRHFKQSIEPIRIEGSFRGD